MKPSQTTNHIDLPRRRLPLSSPDLYQHHQLPSQHQLPSPLSQISSPESQRREQCPSFLRMPFGSSAHYRKTNSSTCSLLQNVSRESKSRAVSDSGQRLLLSAKESLPPPRNEKSITALCFTHPQKRHRECEDGVVKKLCLKSSESPSQIADELSTQSPWTPSELTVKQPFLGVMQLKINSFDGNIASLQPLSKGDVSKKMPKELNGKEKAQTDHTKEINLLQKPQQKSSELSITTPKLESQGVPHHSPTKSNHLLTKQRKAHQRRRTTYIPDDYDQLFTPDVILSPFPKSTQSKCDDGNPECKNSQSSFTKMNKFASPAEELIPAKHCHISSPYVSEDIEYKPIPAESKMNSPHKCSTDEGLTPKVFASPAEELIPAKHCHISLPYVSLVRLRIEDIEYKPIPAESKMNSLHKCSTDERLTPKVCTLPAIQSNSDEDLDLSLGITFQSDSSQASKSSDEDQLLSLEIMSQVLKVPPKSEISGGFSSALNTLTISERQVYNSLDKLLEEVDTRKKSKENEAQLRTACDKVLMEVAEYHEEENCVKDVDKQLEILQRDSLDSSRIREVPPGEEVFHLHKFGQIFNQDSLQLRRCSVKPQNNMQKIILRSSPALLKQYVNTGSFQREFSYNSPCPTQVSQFLFKMMSVHSDWKFSDKILQVLCETAKSATYNTVKNKNEAFTVWIPTLADITLVLMNMGVSFVTLFPLENLQPPFTERDILTNVDIQTEWTFGNERGEIFPEHNCRNSFEYLSCCLSLCTYAYVDDELLLLMTMCARVALDTNIISLGGVKIDTLLEKIVNNVRDWDTMLPRICRALTDLTDDHLNMCYLVQLLPNSHHQFLRQHLSLSMISKLLDRTCQYKPTGEEMKLTALQPYVLRMQPSSLHSFISSICNESSSEDDANFSDRQSYDLCHSLLTLTSQASNFESFPTHQKEHLLTLSSDLRTRVGCNIRTSEKCLYKSKVNDLLTRIYTKWQIVLQQMQPPHSKTRDYLKPSSIGTLPHRCQETYIVSGMSTRVKMECETITTTTDEPGRAPIQQ
nr:SMC5-SMC6 complex localization factor protein 2-like [Nerophis lumbriciformis]